MRKFILTICGFLTSLFIFNFNVEAQEEETILVNRIISLGYNEVSEVEYITTTEGSGISVGYYSFTIKDFFSRLGLDRSGLGLYENDIKLYLNDDKTNPFEQITVEELIKRKSSEDSLKSYIRADGNDLIVYINYRNTPYDLGPNTLVLPLEYNPDIDEYVSLVFTEIGGQRYYTMSFTIGDYFNLLDPSIYITMEIPSGELDYDEIYSMAYEAGKENGISIGYDDGYDVGFEEGKDVGIDIGYDDGYNVGFDAGYDKALEDSNVNKFIANFDKWIVPAIIVVMLLGGYFSVRRQKMEES